MNFYICFRKTAARSDKAYNCTGLRNLYDPGSIVDRASLMHVKYLANIERDYNINEGIQNYPVDSVNFDLEVEKLRTWNVNPILFYKKQKVLDPVLADDDFVFIIMTEFQ